MGQTKGSTPEQIAIYSRKSKFTDKGESIDNQTELCKQYARTHYPNCADSSILVYEGEGFSGATLNAPILKR